MSKYLLFAIFILAACNNRFKADYEVEAELQMIDTLQARLSVVRNWLDRMPLAEIQERKELIKHNYQFCDLRFRETGLIINEENSRLMDEYRGFGKIYNRAADSFTPIVTEMEELIIQLRTLKESAHSKDYEKELFLKYFNKEKEDVIRLYQFADHALKTVIDTDLTFERVEKRVETLAESLKADPPTQNSELPSQENIAE